MAEERVGEDLGNAELAGARLRGDSFVRCRFLDADLTELTTQQVVFDECDFSGARLNVSEHESTAFLRCTFRRTSLFGARLDGCKLTGSTFVDCELRPMIVIGGDWSYVTMRGQRLAGINLRDVRLREADFSESDLTGADLRGTDLAHARLHHTVLRDADLRGAELTGIDLRAVDLTGVRLDVAQAVAVAMAYGAVVS